MTEIELTPDGKRFLEDLGEAYSLKMMRYGRRLKEIRISYGFPHWEIRKALANAGGDHDKAVEILRAHHDR